MPQGDTRDSDLQLYDYTYDGLHKDGRLFLGVGQLLDGVYGSDQLRTSAFSLEKRRARRAKTSGNKMAAQSPRPGYEWVGWRNDSVLSREPIDLTWKFDRVRRFDRVVIHASNLVRKDVGIFRKATLMFSVGGKYYLDDAVAFDLPTLLYAQASSSANISIPLHGRVGQYAKMLLYFSARWMLISEVTFESGKHSAGSGAGDVGLICPRDKGGCGYGN